LAYICAFCIKFLCKFNHGFIMWLKGCFFKYNIWYGYHLNPFSDRMLIKIKNVIMWLEDHRHISASLSMCNCAEMYILNRTTSYLVCSSHYSISLFVVFFILKRGWVEESHQNMVYDMLPELFFYVDSGSEVRIPMCHLNPEL